MNYIELEFVEDDKKIACRLFNKQSNKLLVFFSALHQKSENRPLKVYHRLTWAGDFSYICLFISDPTIIKFPTLRGGYYQGTRDWYAIKYCAEVISKIAASLNITENNILLYGSSQGGFAALAIHSLLHRTKVLAECPQTDLSILTSAQEARLDMLNTVYEQESFDDLVNELRIRTSILKLYQVNSLLPSNIHIIVKETDTIHVNDHVIPLIDAYPKVNLEILKGELGIGGHSAINKSIIKSRIESILG